MKNVHRGVMVLVMAAVAGACSDAASIEPLGGGGADGTKPSPSGASQVPGARPGPTSTPPPPTTDDVFGDLAKGEAQRQALCARGGTNRMTKALCGAAPTSFGGLADLQKVLGLSFTSPQTGRNNNGRNGNPGFVLSGHSSSLVARFVTAINPRAIVFSPNADPDFVAMGFVRGEPFAEVIARDPEQGKLRFFLVAFRQACADAPGGCSPGDLLTPAIEKNWTGATVYEDTDIKNTLLDCTHCHQPGGVDTPKMLRFQELRNPWTHTFRDNTPGGQALLADFHAAHGTAEDYGPVPAAQIDGSDPAKLENLVRGAGFGNQPNEFLTSQVEQEVRRSSPQQPTSNATPGTSATWDGLYGRYLAGEVIAPPYHDVKVTDPAKLQAMTAAYQQFLGGTLAAAKLPDIRDAFLDSAAWQMGFAAKPGQDGAGLLVQMCQSCHNPQLDQTITRARFDVTKLATMDRAEKDKAIERLRLPATNHLQMPPARIRSLTPAEIELAVQELKK